MRRATVLLLLFALVAGGCTSPGSSSEAAWGRAQCDQINDEKMREKCLERVQSELGR